METRVARVLDGSAGDLVWLLEHPALYTAGTSAQPKDLLDARFPVHQTGRGGQYTYHGPGQRIAYVIQDQAPRGKDVRCYVSRLEQWVGLALERFDVEAGPREGRVGLWVDMERHGGGGEAKIAAIGVRVRRWVTFHGLSINVAPDLSHFGGIVPCGLSGFGVTSLAALGRYPTMTEIDRALQETWSAIFG